MNYSSTEQAKVYKLSSSNFFITVFVSTWCRSVIVGTCSEFPHAARSARTNDLADARGAVRSTRTATQEPAVFC